MNRLIRTFLFLVLLLAGISAGLSQAPPPFWQELNGVAGFFEIQEGTGGRLFALLGNGVIYTSTDRGTSWQISANIGGQFLMLSARGNNAIAARILSGVSSYYQIYRTTDNGDSWNRISAAGNQKSQPFSLADDGSAYGLFRDSFFGQAFGPYWLVTYDGVSSWPTIGNPLPNQVTAGTDFVSGTLIDHHGVILVGTTKAGLFLTRDQGQTWEASFGGRGISALALTADNHIYLAANPAISDGGVYVSADGAQSWTYLGFSDKTVTALSADVSGTIVVSTSDGSYRYTGNPDAWEYSGPISESFDVMKSAGADTVLGSSGTWGLFRSVDGGASWMQSGPRKRDVFSIIETSSGTTIAGTLGARTFRSSDDGVNWTQAPAGSICDNIYALAEHGGSLYAGTECGIYRSTDDGADWDHPGSGLPTGPVAALAVLPGGDVYAGTLFGVARSTDGGSTWKTVGLASNGIVSLCSGPLGQLFAVTDQSGVYESDDGGSSWLERGLVRNDLLSVHADEAGTLFVGAYGGVFRSTDSGLSWTPRQFTNGYVSSIASLGFQSVYAAAQQGVFVSSDDGDSWNAVPASGLGFPHVLSLGFDAHGLLFAGTYNGGVFRTAQTLLGVEAAVAVPTAFLLAQNYPNPFNPATVIEFSVPAGDRAAVTLRVFDLLGRQVASLADGPKAPGVYRIAWDASALPAGVYFYRMQAGTYSETKKMLLLR